MLRDLVQNKADLQSLEENILDALDIPGTSLIENDKVAQMIQTARTTTIDLQERLTLIESNEAKIEKTRELYRECARKLAHVYFAVSDMEMVNPMYRSSLANYFSLISKVLEKTKRGELHDRLKTIVDQTSIKVYRQFGRALFDQDRILFSFLLASRLANSVNELNSVEYALFLGNRNATMKKMDISTLAPINWLDDNVKTSVTALEDIQNFKGIVRTIAQEEREWSLWYFTEGNQKLNASLEY
jgi:dynein heavy chain